MAVITTYDQLKAAFPSLTPSSSVGTYVAFVQTLISQTNSLISQAQAQVAAAVALGAPASSVAAFNQAVAAYQQQVSLLQAQLSGLAGYDPNLAVSTLLTTTAPAPAPAGTIGNVTPTAPLPYSGDGVRIFGDTPILLRETDRSIPIEAAMTRSGNSATFVTPEISNDSLTIGGRTFASATAARGIYDTMINTVKGLAAEAVNEIPLPDAVAQASDAREVGSAMNETVTNVMRSLSDAIRVVNGETSVTAWMAAHDEMLRSEKARYDEMAVDKLKDKSGLFNPIVDRLFKVAVAQEVTNSYVLKATLETVITGGPKSDVVVAGNQKSEIRLGGGNGFASGSDFADTFFSGTGRDTIVGGKGADTVVYSSARSAYTVSKQADGTLRVAGPDGTDTLARVERLKFSDQLVAMDTDGNGGMAYRLYQAAFNRTPDQPGLGYQMKALDDGLSISQVAANFIASPEFQRTYGSLDNQRFVTQLYQNVLHRAPDSAGLAFHTANLQGGMARADVLVGFSESPENQAALIGTIQNGMVYTL